MNLNESTKLAEILDNLRTFEYIEQGPDGQPVTVNVELFTAEQAEAVRFMFLQRYGTRPISDLLERCESGQFFSLSLADIIKATNSVKWGHLLGIDKALYNPIWNVDGIETHTSSVVYGKETGTVTISTVTDEQKTPSESDTQVHTDTLSQQIGNTTRETLRSADSAGTYTPFDMEKIDDADRKGVDDAETRTTSKSGLYEHGTDATVTETNKGSDVTTTTDKRGGNIGVTMTQAMLKAEVDFWKSFNFAYEWFATIADVLSIPYFGG